MSNFNIKLLDGYALNVADGYSFQTQWVDVRNAMSFSISVRFFSGTPGGTLSVYCSNEEYIANPMGGVQAEAAGQVAPTSPTLGTQPRYDGLDSALIQAGTVISATGVTNYSFNLKGYHWVRVGYVDNGGNHASSVDIWCNVIW